MEDRFQLVVIVCSYFPPCEFWLYSKTALLSKRKEKPKNKHDGQYDQFLSWNSVRLGTLQIWDKLDFGNRTLEPHSTISYNKTNQIH
jgi:hypothetical protein